MDQSVDSLAALPIGHKPHTFWICGSEIIWDYLTKNPSTKKRSLHFCGSYASCNIFLRTVLIKIGKGLKYIRGSPDWLPSIEEGSFISPFGVTELLRTLISFPIFIGSFLRRLFHLDHHQTSTKPFPNFIGDSVKIYPSKPPPNPYRISLGIP